MRYTFRLLLFLILGLPALLSAQKTAVLEGYVYDYTNKEPLGWATVRVPEHETGTTTDSTGFFRLELEPGLYNVEASFTGYQTLVVHEVGLTTARPTRLDIYLHPVALELGTIEVRAEAFSRSAESPLSLQRVNLHELERMPGAVLDLSRFVKTLPGVSPRTSFGYSMIVRGGASIENRFFLDGIEIPAITHFTVQGTSGGPNGLLNVRMLRGVDFYSGAFPAARPDALSSVTEAWQREGRRDRWGGNFTLGATDFGFMGEGPLGKKASLIVSARESFSQHMFKAIGLPVLPFYSDVQLKSVIHFDEKNELTLVGLGGYDKYTLNLEAEASDALLYNIGYIPEGKQLLYATGAVYKHYLDNGYYTAVLSRNYFGNTAEKYRDNSYQPEDLLLDFRSVEAEDHFRLEHKIFGAEAREWNYGLHLERDLVTNDNYSLYTRADATVDTFDFDARLRLWRYGAFGSFSQKLLDDRLSLFVGLRLDATNYNDRMANPLRQLSPRLSASWNVRDGWFVHASAGRYFQLPPYLLMSFSDGSGTFVNRERLDYLRSHQAAVGIEHLTANGYAVKLEAFAKNYDRYPFLLLDSISYGNANASYALLGNQPADMSSRGRARGIEFQIRQKLRKSWWWMLSYSYVLSQFTDKEGNYRSSAWDNRHFGHVAVAKTFRGGWQVGAHYVFTGGNPWTPYDLALSSRRDVWDVNRRGLPDYDRLNEARLPAIHQLDIRVDKQWNFRRWTLTLFLDVQNATAAPIPLLPYLTVERDAQGQPLPDPDDPTSYQTKIIESDTGRRLPTLGLIADF